MEFIPRHCDRCHERLPPLPGHDDPEATWHQLAALAPIAALVTEYSGPLLHVLRLRHP
jgi:hypothetical protein